MLWIFGRSIPRQLAQSLAEKGEAHGHQTLFASTGNFLSGEGFSELRDLSVAQLQGRPAVLFQSIAQVGDFSANDHWTHLLWLADTLRRYGAGPLWAICPFGPYTRQDHARPGHLDSIASAAAAKHLALDCQGLSCIDIHSPKALHYFQEAFGPEQAYNLSPMDLIAEDILLQTKTDRLLLSPDIGGQSRTQQLAEKLLCPYETLHKQRPTRTESIIATDHLSDSFNDRDIVIVDDIADTLGTLAQTLDYVLEHKPRRVHLYVTHPILSTHAWARLAKMLSQPKLYRITFCHTVARRTEFEKFFLQYGHSLQPKIHWLDMSALLWDHLQNTLWPLLEKS